MALSNSLQARLMSIQDFAHLDGFDQNIQGWDLDAFIDF